MDDLSALSKELLNITAAPDADTTEAIDYAAIVKQQRSKVDYTALIRSEPDMLKKVILCKDRLSPTQWSTVLESDIKRRFNIEKKGDSTSGDGRSSKNQKNVEIKVSLGSSKNGQFNFVQLRPDHALDYYLLMAYNLSEDALGKIYWFLCEPRELYELLPKYGGYAHGTVAVNEKITMDNIYGRGKEYALRPNPTANDGNKSKELWNIMLAKFAVTEAEIEGAL